MRHWEGREKGWVVSPSLRAASGGPSLGFELIRILSTKIEVWGRGVGGGVKAVGGWCEGVGGFTEDDGQARMQRA